MPRQLTRQETSAIKRAMRTTRYISQRLHSGYVDDDGRFIIQSGGPICGTLLEASETEDGRWMLKAIGEWNDLTGQNTFSSEH